ncbi:hypothetical protein DL766_008584 [Monosporascus sp. MC13-8B]|uniref:Amino acid permease/ SLC12A domain-containing protein n=1 Tax=Monosporascus cannonballus TaxID=155416 RepID=A0ABY0H4E1_9PEZI|nr:hypothetical protein DL763_009920 [Monosporascus cannonballus]RYO84296.1 hypothetical protein DL762_005737 [Monosporascus cannonballus]RYP18863.1 hypothetical protein DL766_008584 [Monosporascus sp. MC13-8B]
MTDYDATAHMSAELHDAAISAPVAIVQAIVVFWFFCWLLSIAFGFGTADLDGVLSSPLGNPAAQGFYECRRVWAVVIFCYRFNLIALGSTQTINGILGATAPAMGLSYVAVIAARVYYDKEYQINMGPFTLGRWPKPIKVVAIVWVILFLPLTYPVTALNMNYALCIAAFIALFAITWWFYIGLVTLTKDQVHSS